mgnify:CR=1 FL=1
MLKKEESLDTMEFQVRLDKEVIEERTAKIKQLEEIIESKKEPGSRMDKLEL